MPGAKTRDVAKSGARLARTTGALILQRAAGGASARVSIPVRAKTFETIARLRGPMRALIEDLGDALDRNWRIGETVDFNVAIDRRGRPKITRAQPSNGTGAANGLAFGPLPLAAQLRARVLAAEVLRKDDMLTAEQFADLVGISVVTVYERRRKNLVLGLDGAKRGFRFPSWQLDTDGRPFDVLPVLFARLGGNAWTVYRFLVQHHPELDGLSGFEALQRDRTKQVLDLAEAIAQNEAVRRRC